MPFLEKLKNFILGRRVIKRETYVTELPPYLAEELAKHIDRLREKRDAQLLAENLKLKAMVEKYEEEKKRELEEQKILEQLEKVKKEKERRERCKILTFKIDELRKYIKPAPTFFFKDNVPFSPYHKFIGFVLKQNEDGTHYYYPLLRDKKLRKNVILDCPAKRFEDFFKNDIGIVSQIWGGKVDSNYDITEDGKLVLVKPTRRKKILIGKGDNTYEIIAEEDFLKKYQVEKEQDEVDVIDISEERERELELEKKQIEQQRNQLYYELEKAQKREAKYKTALMDAEVELKGNREQLDILKSRIPVFMQKTNEMLKQAIDSQIALQDMVVHKRESEELVYSLKEALREQKKIIEEQLPKDERRIAKDELREDMEFATDTFKTLVPGVEVRKVIKSPEKEEKK